MSKKSAYLFGILLTIIVGSFLNWKFCCNSTTGTQNEKEEKTYKEKEEHHDDNDVTTATKTASVLPFTVKDADGNLSLNINDNFNFKSSDGNFITPISTSLETGIIKLKDYLMSNENKSLAIKGFYNDDETNNSIYPNLGLARANAIKNYLSSKGIPVNLMDTYGELKDDLIANSEDFFSGATEFAVANAKDNSEALKALGDEIRANPLILYFKTGQASINLTAEQRQKIANISRYLDKVDGAKCIATGHTDNTGNPAMHIPLGKRRAEFAKNYLVKNGISESKIITQSQGDKQPIADNATEEGKAKNRRTEITIQ